jgi:UDP-2-acetamido-3-amino-2,3-dideoxy-glucuronate N-acetyltransferase
VVIRPHDVSLILGMVDETPESVQAHGSSCSPDCQITDTALLALDFPSGIKAHIFVSRFHHLKEQKLVVTGDRQTVVFDDTAPWAGKLISYCTAKRTTAVPMIKTAGTPIAVEPYEPLRGECEHFLHCIKTRTTPATSGDEGLRVIRLLEACRNALAAAPSLK